MTIWVESVADMVDNLKNRVKRYKGTGIIHFFPVIYKPLSMQHSAQRPFSEKTHKQQRALCADDR